MLARLPSPPDRHQIRPNVNHPRDPSARASPGGRRRRVCCGCPIPSCARRPPPGQSPPRRPPLRRYPAATKPADSTPSRSERCDRKRRFHRPPDYLTVTVTPDSSPPSRTIVTRGHRLRIQRRTPLRLTVTARHPVRTLLAAPRGENARSDSPRGLTVGLCRRGGVRQHRRIHSITDGNTATPPTHAAFRTRQAAAPGCARTFHK